MHNRPKLTDRIIRAGPAKAQIELSAGVRKQMSCCPYCLIKTGKTAISIANGANQLNKVARCEGVVRTGCHINFQLKIILVY